MASSFALFLACIACLFFSEMNLSSADEALISNICNTTRFPDFCRKELLSQPGSAQKNFHDLVDLSLSLAVEKGKDIMTEIAVWLQRTTDLHTKYCFQVCYDDYNAAVVAGASRALESFVDNDFGRIPPALDACISGVDKCNRAFDSPPPRQNVLKPSNDVMSMWCAVALDLFDAFRKK